MSTTLRFAKHLRRLNGVGWRVLLNQPRIEITGVKLGLHQTYSLDLSLTKSYATYHEIKPQPRQYGEKESDLQFLCDRISQIGKVTMKTVRKALDEVQKTGKLSSLDALSLIRSCGRPLIESPDKESIEMVHEIWDTCAQLNIQMDVSHYNAVLNVYLEKGHTFSPDSFLTAMKDKSIAPNRITYQRLIAAYCQKGDIAGAAKILKIMNEQGLPLCENIFNSLIIGHSEAGDLQSAIGILETMKKAEVEPSSDTYVSILSAYAKNAQMDLIYTTLDKLENSDQSLGPSQKLEVVYALAVNGHVKEAEKFVDEKLGEVTSDIHVNRILAKLIAIDQMSLMMKVYETASNDAVRQEIRARTILRVLTNNKQILADDILHVCNWLVWKKFDNTAFQTAAYNCFLSERDRTIIYPLFKAWHDQGHQLRPHYFWPILRLSLKNNDVNGMIDIVKTMIDDFGLIPCVETLRDYILPYSFDTWQDSLQTLTAVGVPQENICFAILHRLLTEKQVQNAGKFMNAYRMKYPKELYLTDLVNAYTVRKNARSFLATLQLLDRDPAVIDGSTTSIELTDAAVRQLISVISPYQLPILHSFLTEMENFGLGISPEVGNEIISFLNDKVTPEISETIEKLTTQRHTEIPIVEFNSNTNDGEEKTDSTTLRDLRVNFALALSRENVNEIRKIIQTMEVANLSSPSILAEALEVFCNIEDIVFADRCIELMKNEPNMKLDVIKSLKYAKLLVKKKRINDAMTFISELPSIADSVNSSFNFKQEIRSLLISLSQSGSIDDSFQMLELLQSKNIKMNGNILGAMMRLHLDSGDLVTALDVYERICTQFRYTPYKMDLIRGFIMKEDAQSLQKITDLNKSIYGENNSILDLIFAFIECDLPKQARKICDSWSGRFTSERLGYYINRLVIRDNLKGLQLVPKLLRGSLLLDPNHMYNSILDVYIQKNDWEKGSELWCDMQEADIQPTNEFLEKLAKLLQKNNQEVPFLHLLNKNKQLSILTAESEFSRALNQRDYKTAESLLASITPRRARSLSETMISSILKSENIDKAVDMTKEVIDKYWPLSTDCLSELLWKLGTANRMSDFEALGNRMTEKMKSDCRYYKMHAAAYLRTHGLEAFIKNIKISDEDSAAFKDIPAYTFINTLISDSSSLQLIKEKAVELHQKGNHSLMQVLWSYYFIIESPEADDLWKNYISIEKISQRPIIRYAEKTQDPRLIERLSEFLKQNSTNKDNYDSSLKAALIRIYISLERYQDILPLLQEEPQLISRLHKRSQRNLKRHFARFGQQFSHPIEGNLTGSEESTEMQEENQRDAAEKI